jgi:FemAB-related protein (PEP-CTERM system-associated)
MTLSVESLDAKESHLWDRFVVGHPGSTPFHLWGFGEALAETYGYQRHYMVTRCGDEIVAALPLVFIDSAIFGRKLVSMPFCEHGGLLVSPEFIGCSTAASLLLDKAMGIAFDLGVDYIEIRNPHSCGELMVERGFHESRRYVTVRIDLSAGEDTLWLSLDRKTRNSLRRAMRSELDVLEIVEEDQLKAYFSLYLKTQRKHGSPPHSFELFRNLLRLRAGDNVKALVALYQERPISGIMVLRLNGRAFWWNSVSDVRFSHLNSTSYLLWEMMRSGIREGLTWLDLGRARRGTGVYHFKNRWGGKELDLLDYQWFLREGSNGLHDPMQLKYRILSSIWSLLPEALTERIGPFIVRGIGL